MELEIRSFLSLFLTSSCALQTVDGYDAEFGVNIAYGKPANQSSTYFGDPWYGEPNGFPYIASLAVDGNTNTTFHYGSCSHTAVYESNAWWEVYLQGLYDVSLIKIYQRTDGNENGLNGFVVQGMDSDNSYVTVNQSVPYHNGVITISLQPRRQFKAIKIQLNRQYAFICLCEVEVFAIIKCPNPPMIPEDSDASYIPGIWGNSTYTSSVKISCREGYRLQGTEEIRCTDNGTWSDTRFGTCSAITCHTPPMIPKNSVSNFIPGIAGNLTYNSSVNINCHEGYKLQGKEVATIRCTTNGTWSENNFGICLVTSCSVPPKIPENSDSSYIPGYEGNFTYNSSVEIICHEGYKLQGTRTIRCMGSGTWNETTFGICSVTSCSVPPKIPENSDSSYVPGIDGNFTYNSSVEIICHEGYKLQGTRTIQCMDSGMWNETNFGICSVITCPIPHMVPENSILSFIPGIAGNLTYNSSVNIKCHEGYKLQGKEVGAIRCTTNGTWSGKSFGICFDVDECAYGDNVCNNSGHCINTQGSYKCRCYEGFTGQNCEIETKKDRLKIVAPDFNAQRTEPYEQLHMNTRGLSEYDIVRVLREPSLEARTIEHLYHTTEPHARVEMKK